MLQAQLSIAGGGEQSHAEIRQAIRVHSGLQV